MKRKDEIRERVFDLFDGNLRMLSENILSIRNSEIGEMLELHDLYICPLCNRIFNKGFLNQTITNPLTIEDIPPKSIGSKMVVLTCKSCNNYSGHKLDKHLQKQIRSDAFFRETLNSTIEGNINLDDESFIPVKVENKGNKNLFFHLPKLEEYRSGKFDNLIKNWGERTLNFFLSVSLLLCSPSSREPLIMVFKFLICRPMVLALYGFSFVLKK